MQGRHSEATIAKSSISEMRGKIGYAPLQKLVARACLPLADAKRQPDAFYAGLRLVATDGSNLEVADEPGNVQAFGYPGSRSKEAGVKQRSRGQVLHNNTKPCNLLLWQDLFA